MNKLLIILIILALSLGFFVFRENIIGKAIIESNEVISIPISEISEQAKFYNYSFNGINIEYFAVRAKDGSIKTAFNECEVCFRNKKGYRQEGEFMICNNCGNRYPISGLGTENKAGGGCWPGYLPRQIEGNSIIIKASDLEKGVKLFK